MEALYWKKNLKVKDDVLWQDWLWHMKDDPLGFGLKTRRKPGTTANHCSNSFKDEQNSANSCMVAHNGPKIFKSFNTLNPKKLAHWTKNSKYVQEMLNYSSTKIECFQTFFKLLAQCAAATRQDMAMVVQKTSHASLQAYSSFFSSPTTIQLMVLNWERVWKKLKCQPWASQTTSSSDSRNSRGHRPLILIKPNGIEKVR